MIFFDAKEFQNRSKKFYLIKQHENEWHFYVEQYRNVINFMIERAKDGRYIMNSKSYPFLFLLRHYFEIHLKSILAEQQSPIPKSHNLKEIIDGIPNFPKELNTALDHINLDDDGSCFRYFYQKNGTLNLLYGTIGKLYHFFGELDQLPETSPFNPKLNLKPPFSKRLEWEFTFHFREIAFPGQFRTQYDDLTSYLINAIISDIIDVNDIFLPLLYLIRHSVELALKQSMMESIHITSEENAKKISRVIDNEHSLVRLFNNYIKLLQDVKVSALPENIYNQFVSYHEQAGQLKEQIHLLDSNSRYFRFPYSIDESPMNINKESIATIIETFLKVDTYLTFNVDLLKDQGLIPYTDRELARMFGNPA